MSIYRCGDCQFFHKVEVGYHCYATGKGGPWIRPENETCSCFKLLDPLVEDAIEKTNCNDCIHKEVCGKVRYKDEFDLSHCKDYNTGRPHGEWKFAEEYGTHYCSNCRHFAFNDWLFDYCPDCGAEMWR